jgi:hypothetical protein
MKCENCGRETDEGTFCRACQKKWDAFIKSEDEAYNKSMEAEYNRYLENEYQKENNAG